MSYCPNFDKIEVFVRPSQKPTITNMNSLTSSGQRHTELAHYCTTELSESLLTLKEQPSKLRSSNNLTTMFASDTVSGDYWTARAGVESSSGAAAVVVYDDVLQQPSSFPDTDVSDNAIEELFLQHLTNIFTTAGEQFNANGNVAEAARSGGGVKDSSTDEALEGQGRKRRRSSRWRKCQVKDRPPSGLYGVTFHKCAQ